jgi:hypothetical protein
MDKINENIEKIKENEEKIGMEISNWTIKVMDFGCTELRFVIDIFKSEGLFIRRPFF